MADGLNEVVHALVAGNAPLPAAAANTPAISVVVPVFRSQTTLAELHRRVAAVFEGMATPFEIVFVEDGGGDNSWSVIAGLARRDERVRGLRLARNSGQHNALLCGIRAARGDVIVTIDDDLQNPPEEIPKLLARLTPEIDVVYGTPVSGTHGLLRNAASRITKLALQGAMGASVAQRASAFRAFRTHVREAFDSYRGPSVIIDVLLTWGSTRFDSVDVRQDERKDGNSGYTVGKLITHAINMMTGFSVLPLQVATVLGLCFGAFGLAVLIYVVGRYLIQGSAVPGFSFIASLVAIMSGVQLLALGIFGEYLARMHFRSMDRPSYTVREGTAGTAIAAAPAPGRPPPAPHTVSRDRHPDSL